MKNKTDFPFSPRKVGIGVAAFTAVVVVLLCASSLFETNTAGFRQIKQAAITGTLTCRLEPGMYPQMFGDIHTYKEASTFAFTKDGVEGSRPIGSLPTRFNDGTQAEVSGSVRVMLPDTCEELVAVHRKFKSMNGVMGKLVLPAIRKALFSSGPHMTAAESYAERRAEFAELVSEQLVNGVIKVDKAKVIVTDEITGEQREGWEIRKLICKKENGLTCVNGLQRDPSVFREFGISLTNFVIDEINYPQAVLKQIERQRKARMDIITQQAEAKQAEARAKKAAAEAEAAIAETRAKEEIEKTQRIVKAEADKAEAVLQAEKVKEVAKLEKEAAEFEKKRQILLGEGEAKRKQLVMQADGALEKKLQAWVSAQTVYADALSKAQPGALVPALMMGGNGAAGSNANDLIELLKAKTAKDLSLDFSIKK